jgi:hypothetical protein
MKLEGKHYALIAAFLAGVGTQLATAQHGWSDVLTTGFVAGLLIQISTLITAIFVGAPGATEKLEQAKSDSVDPKRFIGTAVLVVALASAAFMLPACASAPPAGTYSDTGLKTFNADQLLKNVQALSETAINLNAQTGSWHLSDRDTALIRDFALSAGAGLQSYANSSGTLLIVSKAYHELIARLSVDAKVNDQVKFYLALIDGALSNVK